MSRLFFIRPFGSDDTFAVGIFYQFFQLWLVTFFELTAQFLQSAVIDVYERTIRIRGRTGTIKRKTAVRGGRFAFPEQAMTLRIVIGAIIGGGLGFAWHKLVGCSTGSCPLTSHPIGSTLYGMTLGVLVAISFT